MQKDNGIEYFKTGLLSKSITNIGDRVFLCCGGYTEHYSTFTSISCLYPQGAISKPTPAPDIHDNQKCF